MRLAVTRITIAALALVAAGCTMATEPARSDPAGRPETRPTAAAGGATPETPDVTAAANEAMFGQWRRAPAQTTPQVREAAESACRKQDAVGDLPLAVLDARGDGEVTIVFADQQHAAVCLVTANKDGTIAASTARPVAGYPDTPGLDPAKLGVHDLEVVESGSTARTVLVGRVGSDVARVAAQFDDATWSNASMANGWYAMWWPGREPALTVAAVDRRSMAIDGFAP